MVVRGACFGAGMSACSCNEAQSLHKVKEPLDGESEEEETQGEREGKRIHSSLSMTTQSIVI